MSSYRDPSQDHTGHKWRETGSPDFPEVWVGCTSPGGDTLMLLPEASREVSESRRGSLQTADLTQVWWAGSLPGQLAGHRGWPVWISGLARALRLSGLPPARPRAVWPEQGSTNPWPIIGRWEGEIYQ